MLCVYHYVEVEPLFVKNGVTLVVVLGVLLWVNSAKGNRVDQSDCW